MKAFVSPEKVTGEGRLPDLCPRLAARATSAATSGRHPNLCSICSI